MELVLLNAFLYISALVVYYYRYRKILHAGFIVLAVYAIVSIACVINYAAEPVVWRLTLWPFIFLFVVCVLSFRPYFNNVDVGKRIVIRDPRKLYVFCYIYILSAFVVVAISWESFINNLLIGDWYDLYKNERGTIGYTSQIERFIRIFVSYAQLIAMCSFFYCLTEVKKKNILFFIFLALAIILPVFMGAARIGSRGLVLTLVVKMMICYIIFANRISAKIKKYILIASILVLLCLLYYALDVTESRFTRTRGTSESLRFYFGHSMLTFNYGIVDTIMNFMRGNYLLEANRHLYLNGFDSYLGTHFDAKFFTFVGAYYLDWGPIGSLLIALFLPIILRRTWEKPKLYIEDVYVYLFYLAFLIDGVFVTGLGYIIAWSMMFFLYIVFKKYKI
jgi:oligosaccharide repeat unit polymerase